MRHLFRLWTVVAFAALASGVSSTGAAAETQNYALELGQRQVGALQFTTGATPKLTADLNNTPLGVADGVFAATTQAVRTTDGVAATQYLSQSAKRNISVLFAAGRVLDTQIAPTTEATALSDPTAVPAGVLPLTEGFARLAGATSCPTPFAMYEGRRVVQISTVSKTTDGTSEVCTMDYRVTAGPGHLSPFRFKSLGMTLTYTSARLSTIALSAGGFAVRVVRQ